MKKRILLMAAIAVIASASAAAAAYDHSWTGVWLAAQPGKPGVTITLADDSGVLAGTIVFEVMNRETRQRIAIETRNIVNPHLEGSALVFQVRHILKPHLKGEPPAAFDPSDTDVADMTLSPGADGKAILTCAKCGENSPTELFKEK
jgi:hypothetical protein